MAMPPAPQLGALQMFIAATSPSGSDTATSAGKNPGSAIVRASVPDGNGPAYTRTLLSFVFAMYSCRCVSTAIPCGSEKLPETWPHAAWFFPLRGKTSIALEPASDTKITFLGHVPDALTGACPAARGGLTTTGPRGAGIANAPMAVASEPIPSSDENANIPASPEVTSWGVDRFRSPVLRRHEPAHTKTAGDVRGHLMKSRE